VGWLAAASNVDVRALDAARALTGLAEAAPDPALRQAALPLAGALRRHLN
jgi:hypothetical protein